MAGMTGATRKILFIATEDWFFASHFLPMARAARELDCEVVVVARERQHRALIQSAGARLVALEAERGSLSPLALWRNIRALRRVLAQEKPDLVHCIALRSIALGGLAARLEGIDRRVYALTGLGFLGARHDYVGQVARFGVRTGLQLGLNGARTRYLFENPDDPVTLGLDPDDRDKVTIVGGAGVDPLLFMPEPLPSSRPLKVAFVARMLWSKGVDLAVAAVIKARTAGVNVELSLYGAPDISNPKAIPEETLQSWGKIPGIRFRGPTRDISAVWREHHVCCLPSRGGEGLPRTILEAAASGRATITTDVPGCRSFVRDGIDGLVVRAGDAEALSQGLMTLARAPMLVDSMGRAARERVLNGFTERDVMDALKGLYRTMLADAPGSGPGLLA
jgi:glycosyltransferase involved in cell wall biosynthesis